ncbi:MAG: hypothetical protein RXP27_05820 [Nitrososphaeria archaeon]
MRTAEISLAFILPVLLVLSVAFAPLPLAAAPAHAATTSNLLYLGSYAPTTTYPYYEYTQASLNVSAYAGGNVTAVDGVTVTPQGYFDVNFSGITISSGQVTLYVSTNAQAAITPGDTVWVANLPTSYIMATVPTSSAGPLENFYNVTYNGMTFSLGNDSVIGPAPTVAGGSYYIKAFFGSTAPVATSAAQVVILPNIEISPTSGGAGTPITVTGYGFTPNSQANLTWTYNVSGTSSPTEAFELVTTSSTGGFTTTVNAPELKLNGTSGNVTFQANDIARNMTTPPVNFTEYPRQFIQIEEYSPASASWVTFANLTSPAYNGTLTNATFYETEPMIIAGGNFTPNSQVTIYFGSTAIGTATTNGTGFFNVTVTVPVVSAGTYTVKAADPLAYIYFNGSPVPEVIVTPNSVTAGQSVTVSGYAFTAGGTANVTWLGQCIGEHNEIYLATKVPIASDGTFSTSVAVPSPVYGGVHYVYVNDTGNVNASALVFVNPSITLSPSTAPLGSTVTVTLNGLMVGQENWTSPINVTTGSAQNVTDYYGLAQDNIPTYVSNLTGNNYGYATYELTAAGYPMLHAIELVNETATPNVLAATAWLNVTGTTNTEAATTSVLNQMSSQLTTMGSTLTTMQGSLATLTSEYTNLSTAVGNLGSTLNSDYNSLSSSLGSLSSSVSSGFSSLSSTLSSISSGVSSVQSSLGSMSSTLSSVQAEAAQISSVNSLVLATIVIAIIVLVLEVVVLVRHR